MGSERGLFVKVEMNPLWQQKKLREFCAEKGIHITAYSPLGAKGTLWGTDRVMECEVLKEIARETGKSIAQVNTLKHQPRLKVNKYLNELNCVDLSRCQSFRSK